MAKHYIFISCLPGLFVESWKEECFRLIAKPEDTIIFFGGERKYTESEFTEALREWAIGRKEQIDNLSTVQKVNLYYLASNDVYAPDEVVLRKISSWELGKKAKKHHLLESTDESPICGYFCISPDIAVRMGLPVSDEPVANSTPIARFRGDSDPVGVSDFALPVNLAGLFTMVDDPVSPIQKRSATEEINIEYKESGLERSKRSKE